MIIKDKVYGKQEINNNLILEIINTKAMQRLKHINQNSTYKFLDSKFNTSRFDHSLGVYFLLRRLNASIEEQIAGLIHDISHTAFSHVIDYITDNPEDVENQEVHENYKESIINNSEIPSILKNNGLDPEFILNEDNFPILERSIPDLCADRLDYFLRDAIVFGLINKEDIDNYLDSFLVKNNEIIMRDSGIAKKIAENFIQMTKKMWACPFQSGSFLILADAFKLALKNKIISEDDFFLTDDEILEKLKSANIEEISEKLRLVFEPNFREATEEDYDVHSKSKARYIDPKFLKEDKIQRLSEFDKEFKERVKIFKEKIKKGFYIKIK